MSWDSDPPSSDLVVNLWGLIQARGYEHAPGADTSMWKQNLKPRSGRCHVGEESLEGTVFSQLRAGAALRAERALDRGRKTRGLGFKIMWVRIKGKAG